MDAAHVNDAVRVLVVDDNVALHADFRRVLCPPQARAGLSALDADLGRAAVDAGQAFEVVTLSDGHQAVAAAQAAIQQERPFAVAFVDVRMPGGPDGLDTSERLLAADPEVQVVLCTAYADHPWHAITARLCPDAESRQRVLILKKPFDPIEVQQLAAALGAKWQLARDRAQQVQALHAHRRQLQALLDHAPIAVVLTDRHGDVRLVNRAFEQALRAPREHAIGKPLVSLLPEGLRDTGEERLRGVIERGEISENERLVPDPEHPDRPRRYLLTTFPVMDESGQRELCGIATDITRYRGMEDQLRQTQRLEAIGRLAGGVAHDFNNLLTAILGYADLLRMHLPKEDRLVGYAQEIYRSGQRASGLTRQLLAFSRRQVLMPQAVDLNHVLREMERLLSRLIGDDVALELRTDPGLGTVKIDPAQLEQAVMNLAVHARDALMSGKRAQAPRITIATAAVTVDQSLLELPLHQGTTLQPGPCACLSIADNGPGLDAAAREHIFEPFFSAKDNGAGSGLGLSMVYGIVQQSGGLIEVDSQPARGTTFRIYLPVSQEPLASAVATTAADRNEQAPGGHETVLLVEDQDDVRQLLEKVLCEAGYTVLAAEDPKIALDLARQYGGRIHVMVTDIVMPGMDGTGLRDRVLVINPGMKVIFMSGFADRDLAARLAADGRQPFLQKPFKADDLLRAMRSVLA